MSKPVRLGKKEDDFHLYNHSARVEEWLLSHSLLCLIILTAILTTLFIALCFAICGVSATESGVQYNQLQNII